MDVMELTVELAEDFDGDEAALHDDIATRLRNALAFKPNDLTLVEPGSIARTEVGKVQRVYDNR